MKVLNGKYRSETKGMVNAVWVQLESSAVGVADLGGFYYSFSNKGDFVEEVDRSSIFPKVTDHFGQELLEMTIKFKG